MTQSCDNCGQPVLATDTACWHCGHRLAGRAPAAETRAAQQRPGNARARETLAEEAAPPGVVAAYGIITAVIIVAMLLAMRALGRRPLVLANPGRQAAGEWVTVRGDGEDFSLMLPATWTWLTPADPAFADLADGRDQWTAAVFPLGAAADDTAVALVAAPGDVTAQNGGVLVVASSDRLAGLTPARSVALVEQTEGGFELLDANVARTVAGAPLAQFLLAYPDPVAPRQCRQYFIAGATAGYILAGCAPVREFDSLVGLLEDIMLSFEPLPSDTR